MAFFRRSSPLERTYFFYDQQQHMPVSINCCVRGQGTITKAELADAVQKVVEANPGYKLQRRGHLGFSYWDDEGCLPSVETLPESEEPELAGDFPGCLQTPMDSRTGPLIRVFLKPGTPCHLLFQLHHGLTDGWGCVNFVNETFRALRGEALLGSRSRAYEIEICQSVSTDSIAMVKGRAENLTGAPSSDDFTPQWSQRFIPGLDRKQLATKAMWAFSQAVENYLGELFRFRITVDIRRYLGDEITVANASTGIDVDFSVGTSIQEIHSELTQLLKNNAATRLPPKFLIAASRWIPTKLNGQSEAAALRIFNRGKLIRNGTIANMGHLPTNAWCCDTFKAEHIYFVPPYFRLSPLFCVIYSREEGVAVVAAMPKLFADNDRLEELMDRVAFHLGQLVA